MKIYFTVLKTIQSFTNVFSETLLISYKKTNYKSSFFILKIAFKLNTFAKKRVLPFISSTLKVMLQKTKHALITRTKFNTVAQSFHIFYGCFTKLVD